MKNLQELIQRYPVLEPIKDDIQKAYEILAATYENGGKVMICGNGGSAARSARRGDRSGKRDGLGS